MEAAEKERAKLYADWLDFASFNFRTLYGIITPNQPPPSQAAYEEWQCRVVGIIGTLDGLFERTTQFVEKNCCQKFPAKTKKTKGRKS